MVHLKRQVNLVNNFNKGFKYLFPGSFYVDEGFVNTRDVIQIKTPGKLSYVDDGRL